MVFADREDAGMGAVGEDEAQVLNPRWCTRPGYHTTSSRPW